MNENFSRRNWKKSSGGVHLVDVEEKSSDKGD